MLYVSHNISLRGVILALYAKFHIWYPTSSQLIAHSHASIMLLDISRSNLPLLLPPAHITSSNAEVPPTETALPVNVSPDLNSTWKSGASPKYYAGDGGVAKFSTRTPTCNGSPIEFLVLAWSMTPYAHVQGGVVRSLEELRRPEAGGPSQIMACTLVNFKLYRYHIYCRKTPGSCIQVIDRRPTHLTIGGLIRFLLHMHFNNTGYDITCSPETWAWFTDVSGIVSEIVNVQFF
ncbi:uncharacterized protein CLUP02_01681 [Colletotrichum lupini]|uniref:Uncharacterized protein n=1 Tax=Colletotrichum lupini TaxID=145971 RepID=A0A9Q8SDD3_9PEZI|nr:uncharacterized protein CLUP02_01681 [Colletotrichum lupini]UQC75028.1 hypothetical protein CLUP02_01681 [Colletotrichum lupini]